MALKCKNHILQSKRALKLISQTSRRQRLTLSTLSHSSCRQFIMHEKWEHSMDTGFIFKKMNTYRYKREKKIPRTHSYLPANQYIQSSPILLK